MNKHATLNTPTVGQVPATINNKAPTSNAKSTNKNKPTPNGKGFVTKQDGLTGNTALTIVPTPVDFKTHLSDSRKKAKTFHNCETLVANADGKRDAALYAALTRAYEFALEAENNIHGFAKFVKRHKLEQNTNQTSYRNIIKVVFFPNNHKDSVNKTKITKYSKVLAYAAKHGTPVAGFTQYIKDEGGVEEVYGKGNGKDAVSTALGEDFLSKRQTLATYNLPSQLQNLMVDETTHLVTLNEYDAATGDVSVKHVFNGTGLAESLLKRVSKLNPIIANKHGKKLVKSSLYPVYAGAEATRNATPVTKHEGKPTRYLMLQNRLMDGKTVGVVANAHPGSSPIIEVLTEPFDLVLGRAYFAEDDDVSDFVKFYPQHLHHNFSIKPNTAGDCAVLSGGHFSMDLTANPKLPKGVKGLLHPKQNIWGQPVVVDKGAFYEILNMSYSRVEQVVGSTKEHDKELSKFEIGKALSYQFIDRKKEAIKLSASGMKLGTSKDIDNNFLHEDVAAIVGAFRDLGVVDRITFEIARVKYPTPTLTAKRMDMVRFTGFIGGDPKARIRATIPPVRGDQFKSDRTHIGREGFTQL